MRYGIALATLGLSFALLGSAAPLPWAVVCWWAAAAFGAVAAAYFGLGPRLFAKRPDGMAPAEGAAAALADLAPSVDEVIYVHCAAGHGRSAAFAAAVMLARGVASDLEAIEASLRAARPAISLNGLQRPWVSRAMGRRRPPAC